MQTILNPKRRGQGRQGPVRPERELFCREMTGAEFLDPIHFTGCPAAEPRRHPAGSPALAVNPCVINPCVN